MDRQVKKKEVRKVTNRIVGQMALCKSPMWEQCLKSLVIKVDALYLRFDGVNGDREILNKLDSVCGEKLKDVYIGESVWDRWNWREEMIRMLDSVKPEYVLSYDEDEEVGDISQDIKDFLDTNHTQMALDYVFPMPTSDGRELPLTKAYPSKPHVIVIKWKPGLSYIPYIGRKRVTNYGKKYFIGKEKMLHYCFYTPEMEKRKSRLILKSRKKVYKMRRIAPVKVEKYKELVNIKKYRRRSIFHSELYLFWKEARKLQVNRIVESGTYHGFTTNNLERLFPDCEIITYEYKEKYWQKAKIRCAPRIKVKLGVLDKKVLTKKTAVLIDGPKGLGAIELAENIIDKVALVALHDMDMYIKVLKEKFDVVHSCYPSKKVKKLDKFIKLKLGYNKKYYGRVLACLQRRVKDGYNNPY